VAHASRPKHCMRLVPRTPAAWSQLAVGSYVGLVALAFRLLYVVVETRYDLIDGSFFSGDAHLYDRLARSLVAGNGLSLEGVPTAYVVPGYPAWLAFWYTVVGRDFLAIGLIQCFLGAATCVMVYAIGCRLLSRSVGLVAGLLCAVLPEFLMWTSGQILTEPLYTFLITAAVASLVWSVPSARPESGATRSVRWGPALAAGIFLGLAALTRPLALSFGLVVLPYLWRVSGFRTAALVGGVLALHILPWAVRNEKALGAPLMTSTDAGWVLYLYHNPVGTASRGGYDPYIPARSESTGLSELETRRFYQGEAVRFALTHPAREVVLSANRLWNMLRPTYAGSSLRNRLIAYTGYVPFLVLAVIGVLALRFRDARVGLLTLFVLYHLVFHALVAAELRFRIPVEPVLSLFAAFTLVYLARSFFPRSISAVSPAADPVSAYAAAGSPLLTVIVPAFNEARRIEQVLKRIAVVPVAKEIVVVNDGSRDDTREVLSRLGHLYDRFIDLRTNAGKGAAVVAGLEHATGEIVLVQDADGELDPGEYPRLLAPFADPRVQAVFGSRFMPAGEGVERLPVPWVSRAANWVLTGVTNLLFGSQLTDMETGFKVCRRTLLRSVDLQPSRYEMEPELAAKLLRKQVRIYEVPVSYFPRARAEKVIGFRDGISALRVLLRIRLRYGARNARPAFFRRMEVS
jgi:dolichol-phosphate mannosyltransferase